MLSSQISVFHLFPITSLGTLEHLADIITFALNISYVGGLTILMGFNYLSSRRLILRLLFRPPSYLLYYMRQRVTYQEIYISKFCIYYSTKLILPTLSILCGRKSLIQRFMHPNFASTTLPTSFFLLSIFYAGESDLSRDLYIEISHLLLYQPNSSYSQYLMWGKVTFPKVYASKFCIYYSTNFFFLTLSILYGGESSFQIHTSKFYI